jgi:ribosomal protein S18 acetylase RimI-like enzyme
VSTRLATDSEAPAVAALHAERIAEGFLATLGPRFLTRLYRRMVRSPRAFVVVAGERDGLDGFVAVAEDTRRFYREFLLREGVAAAAASARALLRSPRRVWETLRYGTGHAGNLPPAEVLSVAVAPRAAGRGLGTALVTAAVAELERRDIHAVRVVTAVGNTPALRMYERAGFTQCTRVVLHAGVEQEVLVWR